MRKLVRGEKGRCGRDLQPVSTRAKRRAARVRLKRLAVFLPLAACAPFWLGNWGSDGLAEATGANARQQAANPPDRAGTIVELPQRPYLAATLTDAEPIGIVTEGPPTTTAAPPVAARPVEVPRLASPQRRSLPRPVAASDRPGPQTRTMRMLVTAYCPCRQCCGGCSDGITACGKSIYTNQSRFVAADTRLLGFGTRVSIAGYYGGTPISVLDRGGKIKGHRIDVFFLSHERARKWGARWMDVTVYED